MGLCVVKKILASLLSGVKNSRETRDFSLEQLKQLSAESRRETIESVSITGGHLGASLGVIELTVAPHHVFDTPRDRIIWDVSHQAYPHKFLTGRRDGIRTLRQGGGLSVFTKRAESEFDPFGAALAAIGQDAAIEAIIQPARA